MNQPKNTMIAQKRFLPTSLYCLLRMLPSRRATRQLTYVLLLSIPLQLFSADIDKQLDEVSIAIYKGRVDQARSGIQALAPLQLSVLQRYSLALLEARILRDTGQWHDALEKVIPLIELLRVQDAGQVLLAEAYLEYAHICKSLHWLERFNSAVNSVQMIVSRHHMPDHLRTRYHTFRLLYLSLMLLGTKGQPTADSIHVLLDRAKSDERYKYEPDMALSILLTHYRNYTTLKAYAIADSVFSLIDRPESEMGSYGRFLLWRALGNQFMDRMLHPQIVSDNRENNFQTSVRCFEKALTLISERYPTNHADRVIVINLKGLLSFHAKRYRDAFTLYKQGERILSGSKLPIEKYTYLYFMTYSYELAVIDSLFDGEALRRERTRQIPIWENIADHWPHWEQNNLDSLNHLRVFYTTEVHGVLLKLMLDQYHDTPDPKILERAFDIQDKNKFRTMKQHLQEMNGMPMPRSRGLQEVRQSLSSDEAIISFTDVVILENTTFFLVVTKDTVVFDSIQMLKDRINEVGGNQGAEYICKDVASFRNVYHQLWQITFRKIEPFLKNSKRLLILPSGYFSLIQIDLLLSDTTGAKNFGALRYLRDRYKIRYDYSLTLSEMRQQHREASKPVARQVALIPDYTGTPQYRLPYFKAMGQEITDRYGFEAYGQKNATLSSFQDLFPKVGMLHIAAHGFATRVTPSDQFIVMDSVAPGIPFRLTPHHFLQARTNADLVVLSICLGGESQINQYDNLNLAYWFSYAGARSCLFSKWKIDDKPTAWIISRFYEYLSKGMDKTDALYTAQNDYLRSVRTDEERNPIYWGGLRLIGDNAKLNMVAPKGLVDSWQVKAMGLVILSAMCWGVWRRMRRSNP